MNSHEATSLKLFCGRTTSGSFVSVLDSCGWSSPLTASSETMWFSSPGYSTTGYENGLRCSWTVRAPPGGTVVLGIEDARFETGCYDGIVIFQGLCRGETGAERVSELKLQKVRVLKLHSHSVCVIIHDTSWWNLARVLRSFSLDFRIHFPEKRRKPRLFVWLLWKGGCHTHVHYRFPYMKV